jgi:DNA-binding NarL/FixJ family response regulator
MPVRMLLTTMPEMLNSIILSIVAAQPALQVVARIDADDDLAAAAQGHDADVVVMCAEMSGGGPVAEELLFTRPRMRVLILTANGRAAHLYRLLPHRMTIDDISPEELVNAMLESGIGARQD